MTYQLDARIRFNMRCAHASSPARTFTLDGGNIVWGRNWDLIFPIEQLHEGVIK